MCVSENVSVCTCVCMWERWCTCAKDGGGCGGGAYAHQAKYFSEKSWKFNKPSPQKKKFIKKKKKDKKNHLLIFSFFLRVIISAGGVGLAHQAKRQKQATCGRFCPCAVIVISVSSA